MAVHNINCSQLTNAPSGAFNLTVRLIDAQGNPVISPYITQNQVFARQNSTVPFKIPFVVTSANYTIPNVRYMILLGTTPIWTSNAFDLTVACGLEDEIYIAPSWLLKFAYTYDADTHEFSAHSYGDVDLEVKINATSDPQPSGLSQNDLIFNNNVWVPGGTQFIMDGYNKVFRFNPIANGTGGILPGKDYQLRARRKSNPTTVFVVNFTTPVVDAYTPINLIVPVAPPVTTTQATGVTTTQAPPQTSGVLEAFIHFN